MIIVKPNGGLGNRMRVIHSAMLLAKIQGQKKIKVLWKKDSGLNAGFFDLFQPIPKCKIHEELRQMTAIFYLSKVLRRFDFYDDLRTIKHQFDTNYWKKISNNVLMNTCMDFLSHEELGNFYSLFKPVHNIQVKIDDLVKSFSDKTIGVQIRRTDNQPSIAKSKTDNFIDKMKSIINEEPATTFFLATDDKSLELHLKEIFPDKIIAQPNKDLSRNTGVGVKSALVDMYALSATKFILGSFQSSFGEVAAAVGRIQFLLPK